MTNAMCEGCKSDSKAMSTLRGPKFCWNLAAGRLQLVMGESCGSSVCDGCGAPVIHAVPSFLHPLKMQWAHEMQGFDVLNFFLPIQMLVHARFMPSGQIASVLGKLCISLEEDAAVVLSKCDESDGNAKWEVHWCEHCLCNAKK